ncbi:hypothetical protein PGB34_21600 [Xenophilus arseniciresistens]|uniref:DUF7064 domain-containing protein n=1 Tax=Xenophilus arseniciresistens TaxID=1283306 RepID=A0AAE3NCP3_9BURK|nr:hypothetical protein [Xenophilus arseniciresistens]MDA7418973.1 hypothetical protein [Xenophilus arseniciresistens]
MYMPPDTRLKLDPQDEYTHTPEPVGHYNESMYFNAFDSVRRVGAWVRIGNRPNEGHAEMSCCVYLPDGRVGFMFGRPAITGNERMAAAGMCFEVIEPFKRHRVRYEGELLIMDDALAMADPSSAFKRYPKRPALIELDFEGISPMHGGEIVDLQGQPIVLDPAHAVYRGHTEQNMAVNGHITVDGQRHAFQNGTGYRDKSWGPRHWHSFFWYKWLPVTFSRDFGILLSIKGRPEGGPNRISGNVLRDGVYESVIDGRIETDYDEAWIPRSLTAWVTTQRQTYVLKGRVLTTVPLRHRKVGASDFSSYTRITESLSEYSCEGHTVLGMTEYCDVMNDGVPISERAAAPA